MSALALCLAPHPALRATAQPVTTFSEDLRVLARDLIETMYAHDGIGLAAPQVGRGLRMVVANPSRARGREFVVVNPVLEDARGHVAVTEGCLSLPNTWERVRRAAHVRITGVDVSGRPLNVEAEGLLAIVLQHECDHLDGRLLTDRLSWFRGLWVGRRARSSRAPDRAVR